MDDMERIKAALEYCMKEGRCTECQYSEGAMFATCRYLIANAIILLAKSNKGGEAMKWHWKDEVFVFLLFATIAIELVAVWLLNKFV